LIAPEPEQNIGMASVKPIDALRAKLRQELDPQKIFDAPTWGNPRVMTEVLKEVRRELGGTEIVPLDGDQVQKALLRFLKSRTAKNFTDLKYVCHGLTVPFGRERVRLIDQRPMVDSVLQAVERREGQPRQFRRCYQGLLGGYFGFDWYAESEGQAIDNWTAIREFLRERLKSVLKESASRSGVPDWLQVLNSHHNLLTDDPCSRYAQALSRGDSTKLKEACEGLGIPNSSWVWSDALIAYVRLVCEQEERGFKKGLDGILNLVNGQKEIKLPPVLRTTAAALCVVRYSRCTDKVEHAALRDTCVQWIGNPWLKRTAWDAHVNDEPARQMVDGWLKRRLVQDFFELLAYDGAADLRRLNYWLKWAPQITDMWFVLGSDARDNRTPEFMDLRRRMAGRDRVLTDNNSQNNAFVMRIGPLLVIEFGVTGNACYVFAAADFRTSLERPIFSIHELKQRASATRLSHMASWEYRFDFELNRLLQSVPASKGNLKPVESPASGGSMPAWAARQASAAVEDADLDVAMANLASAMNAMAASASAGELSAARKGLTDHRLHTIRTICEQRGVEWEDNRAKGGALWVLIPDRSKHLSIALLLNQWGFHHSAGKGYWFKG
jgi:hypothetical protein